MSLSSFFALVAKLLLILLISDKNQIDKKLQWVHNYFLQIYEMESTIESFIEKIFKQIASGNLFIGKGDSGEVYGPCVWKSKTYATKKRMFSTDTTKVYIEEVLGVCEKWKSLDHRNLITVYEVSFDSPTLYILMDAPPRESLQVVLKRYSLFDLPLEILKNWGAQIVEGMAYLHRKDIVHRDLKSPNSKFYAFLIFSHTDVMTVSLDIL